jgi:hypothetical protein
MSNIIELSSNDYGVFEVNQVKRRQYKGSIAAKILFWGLFLSSVLFIYNELF